MGRGRVSTRRRRRRAPADPTHPRHGKAVFRPDWTGPASSKPQPMSELRNHPRKLTPNSQPSPEQDNHPPLSRPSEDCEGCPPLAGFAIWSGRSQSRSSRFTLQFRWRGAPPAAKSLGNSRIGSPGLTPSGRVDAVRGGSSFVAAHWGDEAPDAVGDGCSGNFGLRRRHVGPLTTGTATGHSPWNGIRR